jgi:hypothetical protein
MGTHRNRQALLAAAVLLAVGGLAGSAAGRSSAAPVNKSRPSISGSAVDGGTLSVDVGNWSGTQPITYSVSWVRCDRNGGNCIAPPANNNFQYKVTSADVGARMRVNVTAQNRDGRGTAMSPVTPVIKPAPAQAPANTSPPRISGTAQEGQVLSGDKGQWTGTSPIDYNLYWQRCDRNGNGCADISGATGGRYKLGSADVGNRVRLRVRALNGGGSVIAYSAPTDVVAAKGPQLPAGAIKLPDGRYSIPATSVSPPERLVIGQFNFSPNPLRSRNAVITAQFRIFDTRGYVVRDALVFVTPLPYGWVTQPPETVAATDGWATVHMRANRQLPRRAAIVMFVRARKSGDPVLTGVSNRRLVQMLVSIP